MESVFIALPHIMGVVLKPMQDFQYPSDICRYGCVFLLQQRKTAKGRRKVRERSEYTYQNVIYYSCLADIVAFIQPLNNIFAIGMGFSIGTEKPAHPLIKHEFKKSILQARHPRKVGERRVCQDPTKAQNGLVCFAMLPLQKPFEVFSTCVSVVGQSAK